MERREFERPAHAVDWYRETVEEYNAANGGNFAPSAFAEHTIQKNCHEMNRHGDELDEVAEWVHVKVDAEESADYDGGPPSCLLYTSPSPRDRQKSRMPSSA